MLLVLCSIAGNEEGISSIARRHPHALISRLVSMNTFYPLSFASVLHQEIDLHVNARTPLSHDAAQKW